MRLLRIFLFLVLSSSAAAAAAHFQLIYTPYANLATATTVPVRLIFWHPFDNGEVMPMKAPQAFYMVRNGRHTNLLDKLSPVTFTGRLNAAQAFAADVPLKRVGDYAFVVVPVPYFEAGEQLFIQQFTKTFVNRGGIPGQWAKPLGLPAEIVPLVKPTNVVVGSTFTGRVLSSGEPVSGAEVEVEFMAAEPDAAKNQPRKATATPMSGGTVVVMADVHGYFTFGIPRAGYWGFAALKVGSQKIHEGQPLSQDAVLWVRAHDMH